MAKQARIQLRKITELKPTLKQLSWKIEAKVSFETKEIKPCRNGKMFIVLLRDDSGTIKGISYDNHAERFMSEIKDGGKYFIKGAEIISAHSTNRTGHKYELRFRNTAEFEDVSSGVVCLLNDIVSPSDVGEPKTAEHGKLYFDPIQLNQALEFQRQPLSRFDIMAVVKKTAKKEMKYNSETSRKFWAKKVTVIDRTGEVTVSFTADKGKEFDEVKWSEKPAIAVKRCVWKTYGRKDILSAELKDLCEEKELLESDRSAMKEIKQWYEGTRRKAPRRSSTSKESTSSSSRTSTSHEENGEKQSVEEPRGIKRPCEEQKERKPPVVHMRKERNTCKSLKTVKEHSNLGLKTAKIVAGHGSEMLGTGFRVGSSYLLTAFHVMEDLLETLWKALYSKLSEEERNAAGMCLTESSKTKSVTEQLLPDRGAWSVSEKIENLDRTRRDRLHGVAKQMFTDAVSLFFDFTDDNAQSSIQVSYDVPFVSRTHDHDFVILELHSEDHLPERMYLQRFFAPEQWQDVILLGHPNGACATFDNCKILDGDDFKEWRSENVNSSRNVESDRVVEEYENLHFSTARIYFHASDSMGEGCSGGPILTHEQIPKVIGFYDGGLPKSHYDTVRQKDIQRKIKNKPQAFIEVGIPMEVVADVLSEANNFDHLKEDIFMPLP